MYFLLNGKSETLEQPLSIATLLDQLQLDARRVAVERNEDVVSRKLFASTEICEGDRLEVVTFVGGG